MFSLASSAAHQDGAAGQLPPPSDPNPSTPPATIASSPAVSRTPRFWPRRRVEENRLDRLKTFALHQGPADLEDFASPSVWHKRYLLLTAQGLVFYRRGEAPSKSMPRYSIPNSDIQGCLMTDESFLIARAALELQLANRKVFLRFATLQERNAWVEAIGKTHTDRLMFPLASADDTTSDRALLPSYLLQEQHGNSASRMRRATSLIYAESVVPDHHDAGTTPYSSVPSSPVDSRRTGGLRVSSSSGTRHSVALDDMTFFHMTPRSSVTTPCSDSTPRHDSFSSDSHSLGDMYGSNDEIIHARQAQQSTSPPGTAWSHKQLTFPRSASHEYAYTPPQSQTQLETANLRPSFSTSAVSRFAIGLQKTSSASSVGLRSAVVSGSHSSSPLAKSSSSSHLPFARTLQRLARRFSLKTRRSSSSELSACDVSPIAGEPTRSSPSSHPSEGDVDIAMRSRSNSSPSELEYGMPLLSVRDGVFCAADTTIAKSTLGPPKKSFLHNASTSTIMDSTLTLVGEGGDTREPARTVVANNDGDDMLISLDRDEADSFDTYFSTGSRLV